MKEEEKKEEEKNGTPAWGKSWESDRKWAGERILKEIRILFYQVNHKADL